MYSEYFEITTEVVMKTLGCTRQYVSELVRKEKLIPSGRRGKSYTFRLSELSKVLNSEEYLRLVIRIDDLLTTNLPEIFEKKEPKWKVQKRGEARP